MGDQRWKRLRDALSTPYGTPPRGRGLQPFTAALLRGDSDRAPPFRAESHEVHLYGVDSTGLRERGEATAGLRLDRRERRLRGIRATLDRAEHARPEELQVPQLRE